MATGPMMVSGAQWWHTCLRSQNLEFKSRHPANSELYCKSASAAAAAVAAASAVAAAAAAAAAASAAALASAAPAKAAEAAEAAKNIKRPKGTQKMMSFLFERDS